MKKVYLLIIFPLIFGQYLLVNGELSKPLPETCQKNIECTITSEIGDTVTMQELNKYSNLRILRDLRENSTFVDELVKYEEAIMDVSIKQIHINGLVYLFLSKLIFKVPKELYDLSIEIESPFNKTYNSLQECFEAYCNSPKKSGVLKCTNQKKPENWIFDLNINTEITNETQLCAENINYLILRDAKLSSVTSSDNGFFKILSMDAVGSEIANIPSQYFRKIFGTIISIKIDDNIENFKRATRRLMDYSIFEVRTPFNISWREENTNISTYDIITRCISTNTITSYSKTIQYCSPIAPTPTTSHPVFTSMSSISKFSTTVLTSDSTLTGTPTIEETISIQSTNSILDQDLSEGIERSSESADSIINILEPITMTSSDTKSETVVHDNKKKENYSTLRHVHSTTLNDSISKLDVTSTTDSSSIISNKSELTTMHYDNIKTINENVSATTNKNMSLLTTPSDILTTLPKSTIKREDMFNVKKRSTSKTTTNNAPYNSSVRETILNEKPKISLQIKSSLTEFPILSNQKTTKQEIIEDVPFASALIDNYEYLDTVNDTSLEELTINPYKLITDVTTTDSSKKITKAVDKNITTTMDKNITTTMDKNITTTMDKNITTTMDKNITTTMFPNENLTYLNDEIKALHAISNERDQKSKKPELHHYYQSLVQDDSQEHVVNANTYANKTIIVSNNNTDTGLSPNIFPQINSEYKTEPDKKLVVIFYIVMAIFVVLFTAFLIYYFYELN